VTGVLIWGVGLMFVVPLADSVPLLVTLFIVTTVSGSLPAGAVVALTSEVLRPETRSTGMGIFFTWSYAGIALGPILAGFISDATANPAAPVYLIGLLALLTVVSLGLFRALQARGFPAVVQHLDR
jgi:MFS family permease